MKMLLILPIALYLCGGMSRAFFLAGSLAELAYLASRGIELGRLPLIGPHDTLVFFSTSCAVMTLPFLYARGMKDSRQFRWGAALLAATTTLMALPFPAFTMPLHRTRPRSGFGELPAPREK